MRGVPGFDKAINHSEKFKKRHPLPDNGFSIACRPDIFTCESLFNQAFPSASKFPAIFNAIGTDDFKQIIRMLENASNIIRFYLSATDDTASKMSSDAKELKNILVQTIARNHPEIPNDRENE